ncbi:hypothetical protein, partial [Rhizobium leguminosarum]|uniref:hypothetical protein n=1 Tax=Rhizobium leguminosarum TaxID=384 RepID=UPI003F9A1B0B
RTPADGHPPECAPIIQQSVQIEHARGPHGTPFIIGATHSGVGVHHQHMADAGAPTTLFVAAIDATHEVGIIATTWPFQAGLSASLCGCREPESQWFYFCFLLFPLYKLPTSPESMAPEDSAFQERWQPSLPMLASC